MATASVPDAEQRALALSTGASWIVEAPAGSGKTGLLIQRYLKLLATVDDPSEVLALTFTQKATGEMRERVLAAIRSAHRPEWEPRSDFDRLTHTLATAVAERDRQLGWHLAQRPHRLNIRTIDSLCSEIARGVPLLEGGIGTASPVGDATPLYRRAARAVMMRLGGDDPVLNNAIETVLLHRDGDLLFCEKVLAEMLATREQWGRVIALGTGDLDDVTLDSVALPRLNRSLGRTLCASLTELHRCFPETELEQVAEVARRLAFAEGYKGAPSAFAGCATRPGTPGTEAHHHDHWLLVAQLLLTNSGTWRKTFQVNLVGAKVDKDTATELKALIHGINSDELAALLHAVRDLPPAEFPPEQWVVTKALLRLLQHALVELQMLFARDGVCDFSAVALAARAALRDGTDLQVSMGTRLRHLLVDEMQDTSTSQYELLETLTASWDGSSQTVFLVGDPKQSIYLFRQARVELFQRCMEVKRLGDLPLGVLRLSANFRSGSHLVRQFNETFLQVFPAEAIKEGDVCYSPADGTQPEKDREGIAWHMRLLPPRPADAAESMRQRQSAIRREAAEIATLIQQAYAVRPPLRIAVLTRARSHVAEVAKALRRNRIPFRAVDMETLGERREVLDVLAVTRALLHPADRTAWLAVLHAPWCGAGLADLYRLAAGDRPEARKDALRARLRERLSLLAEPMQARVARTLNVMDAALHHTGAESLANRVERTWRSLGGDRCTDATGCENVRQFLRVLDEMQAGNEPVNVYSLERRLERLFAAPESAQDAVEIMTVHKAKGLEWDLVLIPGMHRLSAQDRYPALDWLEMAGRDADGTRDVLLAPLPAKGGDAGKLFLYIRSTRRQRSLAELKRVLYVAATRARTALHLFASPESTREGQPVDHKATLLKAAGEAGRVHLKEQELRPPGFASDSAATETFAIAAAEEGVASQRAERPLPTLEKLPDSYDPLRHLHEGSSWAGSTASANRAQGAEYQRPEGTFGARAVGSAIHAFLERLAGEFAQGITRRSVETAAEHLLRDLPSWRGAILAVLRAGGLPPAAAARAVDTVLRALVNTLTTVDGRWLLLPHAAAASEAAWRTLKDGNTQRVRLDRTFFAGSRPGSEPGSAVQDTLWIVDFKTADRAEAAQEAFLAEQKEQYRSQLETYARVRLEGLPSDTPVMLGLFFPLMGRLVCWPFDLGTTSNASPHPPVLIAAR